MSVFCRATAALALLFVLAATGCDDEPLPELGRIPDFELVAQSGEPYDASRLEGQVTVVSFIFTRCPTICPLLTERMIELQARFDGEDGVRFLSFSVDPDNDTPEVLRAYGEDRGADFSRYTFVTGPIDEVNRVVVRGFKQHMGEPVPTEGDGYDIMHSSHFALVDAHRQIRGFYRSNEEGMADLVRDAERLLDE